MKIIDMEKYERKAHFNYFRSLAYPYVGITADVDVSSLVTACKEKKVSFYIAFMHAAALAADRVKEMRQRIFNDGIVEYSECPTSHIELLDDGTYCYCTLHHHMDINEYFKIANETRNKCKENGQMVEDDDVNSMYFISTLPWIKYTSLIQPVAAGDESNPRITWGKYELDNRGKILMPVSILAHHALVDGSHIAEFYKNLDIKIDSISKDIMLRL